MNESIEIKLRCLDIAERTLGISYKSGQSMDVVPKDVTEIIRRAVRFEDFVTGKMTIDSIPGLIDRLRDVLCSGDK